MGDQEQLNRAMDDMFLYIPLEYLMRLKLRSRKLNALITDFRRRHTPTTDTGLVIVLHRVHRENPDYQYHESIFLPPLESQVLRPVTSMIQFEGQDQQLHLRGSCNGFLLYDGGAYDYVRDNILLRSVAALPKQHEWRRHHHARLGLASEEIGSDFQVLYLFYNEIEDDMMKCELYSSERGEWSLFSARIHNIVAMGEAGFNRETWFGSSLYYDGRLYWIWSICMLRYDIGSRTFTLFSLPPESRDIMRPFSQLLYESDGQIYLCFPRDDSLHIFAFVAGDGGWEPRRTVRRQEWIDQDSPRTNWSEFWYVVRPVAFNQDLQQLLLFVRKRIVSYSLETGRFVEVCTCEEMEGYVTWVMAVRPLLFKSETSSTILWKRRE